MLPNTFQYIIFLLGNKSYPKKETRGMFAASGFSFLAALNYISFTGLVSKMLAVSSISIELSR